MQFVTNVIFVPHAPHLIDPSCLNSPTPYNDMDMEVLIQVVMSSSPHYGQDGLCQGNSWVYWEREQAHELKCIGNIIQKAGRMIWMRIYLLYNK